MIWNIEEKLRDLKEQLLKDNEGKLIDKFYIRLMIDDDEDTYTTKKFGKLKEVGI